MCVYGRGGEQSRENQCGPAGTLVLTQPSSGLVLLSWPAPNPPVMVTQNVVSPHYGIVFGLKRRAVLTQLQQG